MRICGGMSVAKHAPMRRRFLASFALLISCTTTSPPPPVPDVATGPLQLNDVSILFPLSKTYLSASSSGARGTLLPESLYYAIGPITGSTLPAGVGGDGSAQYGDLHVVAMRIDPCFGSLDPAPDGSGCTAQLRLIFQELTQPAGEPLNAFDSGLHAFYELSRADLLQLAHDIAEYRAASSTGRLGALAVNPIFASEGEDGDYATGLRALILKYAGAQNLTRVTELSMQNDDFLWKFSGVDVSDAASDQFTALPIPSLAGSAVSQTFFRNFGPPSAAQYMPSTTSADDLTALAGSDETTAQAQAAFAALVRIDNPSDNSPNTIDCASCHTATPLSLQIAQPEFGLVEATAPGAFQADGTYVLASELTPTFPADLDGKLLQFHVFSYIGITAQIDQRVVNESAAVVVYLNQALGL